MQNICRLLAVFILPALLVAGPGSGLCQTQANSMPRQHETVGIIVTTSEITIGTRFAGTDLYIAGVLENADPLARRQNRYDIIVTLEGPSRPVILRKKQRRMGVWVNAEAMTFVNVPVYYALASTRELRDISIPETYKHLGLGIENLPLHADTADHGKTDSFRRELVRLKKLQHLYSEHTGAVTFGSPMLFSARFPLPTNIPVGNYSINAYLFRDGAYIDDASTRLDITKEHFAYSVYRAAHHHSFWYGMTAVMIAVIIGFTGRLLFRRE